MTFEITQEDLWKLPNEFQFVLQVCTEQKWEFIPVFKVEHKTLYGVPYFEEGFIGTLDTAFEVYCGFDRGEYRICRISRYLNGFKRSPIVTEIVRYKIMIDR